MYNKRKFMKSFKKGKFFYAGDFLNENCITGVGIKSSFTEVKFGHFSDDTLNGPGVFLDAAKRLIMSNYKDGHTSGPTFLLMNGKMRFEEHQKSTPINYKAFFNDVNFGMVLNNSNRAIWYTFNDSTLHIRNDEYEEKTFIIPDIISPTELKKCLEIGLYPTYLDKNPNEVATHNFVSMHGNHSCNLVKQNDGSYLLVGKEWKKTIDKPDFLFMVKDKLCEYQRKNADGVTNGLCFSVTQEEAQIFLAKDAIYDGPAFYFNPYKDEIFQLVIYRNDKLETVYALTKDFMMIHFDKNGNVLEKYNF